MWQRWKGETLVLPEDPAAPGVELEWADERRKWLPICGRRSASQLATAAAAKSHHQYSNTGPRRPLAAHSVAPSSIVNHSENAPAAQIVIPADAASSAHLRQQLNLDGSSTTPGVAIGVALSGYKASALVRLSCLPSR